MAKKEMIKIAGDSDAENAMVRMDALDRKIATEQATIDAHLAEIDKIEAKVKLMGAERKELFKGMEMYFVTRKGFDFTGEGQSLREKKLKRGVVGFRLAPASIKTLSRDWTEAKCICAMKELMRSDAAWKKHAKAQLIRIKESLNKDAIKNLDLDAATLAKCGLQISQEDLFWARTAYEDEMEQAKREAAA